MFTPSRKSCLYRRKRHLGTLPYQNQKGGEQRVYVDSFCCIIRKAGATLRAATASGFLFCFFPHQGESDIKVGETSMICVRGLGVCLCMCDLAACGQKAIDLHH